MSEFGFFFFLRIAVAVSSFWGGSVIMPSERRVVMLTSLASAPDGSLGKTLSEAVPRKVPVASKLTWTDPPWGWCSLQPTW
jgi:hypothetical protein